MKTVHEGLSCVRGSYDFKIMFAGKGKFIEAHDGTLLYPKYYYVDLNLYLRTYSVDNMIESFLENERIRASVLIDSLLKGKEYLENTVMKLENSIDKIEEWKARLGELNEEIRNIHKQIPYLVANYYGIQ